MTQIELLKNSQVINKNLVEYYNALATNIQFSGRNIQTIVISSVKDNEGKSTVAINLCKSLAELGKKVLLIDSDTRNSVLLQRFKVRGKVEGLTSYLSGFGTLTEVVHSTDIPNLNILPAGQVPPNPTRLLQNEEFVDMLQKLKQYYDYIILDAPPVGMVIDAAIIAKHCDGSLLVVEAGSIKRKFVKKAVEQLEQSGSRFLGVVLNKLDFKIENYGGYGSYPTHGKMG